MVCCYRAGSCSKSEEEMVLSWINALGLVFISLPVSKLDIADLPPASYICMVFLCRSHTGLCCIKKCWKS